MKKDEPQKIREIISNPYTSLLLGLSMVLIVVATIISYESSIRLVRDQESDKSKIINKEILQYLETPMKVNQMNADLLKIGLINKMSPSEIRYLFANQYRHFGKVTLIAMGLEDGTYFDVQYLDGSNLYSSERNQVSGNSDGWHLDQSGEIVSLESTYEYDHRKRPWYISAKNNAEKKAEWTSVYITINPKSLFLSAYNPIYINSQEFVGTMVSSLSLIEVGKIIRSVPSIEKRQIYILERDGNIIASTEHDVPFSDKDGNLERINAAHSEDQILSSIYNSQNYVEGEVELKLIDSRPFFVSAYAINDGRGIDWQIIIANPANIVLRQIGGRFLLIALISFITILIGIGIGKRIGYYLSKPIIEIKNAANQIVQGNLKERVSVYKNNEIGEMAMAFNRMGETIEEHVNTLEEKVKKRTEELEFSNQQIIKKNNHLNEKNAELQKALDKIKVLQGLVPICSNCKKIRDDKGYWKNLESYIEEHSDAEFTHGLCEECSKKLYGDKKWFKKLDK